MQAKLKKMLGVALIALAPTAAMASSHREAPSISQDPEADNTDLYAWVTPGTHANLNVVANYIPLEEPAGGPNFNSFSDDVLYEVHIYKGDDIHNDFLVYQFDFKTTHVKGNPNDPTQAPFNGINFFSQIAGDTQTYTVKRIDRQGHRTTLASNVPVAPPNIGPSTDALAGRTYDDAFIAANFVKPTSDGGQVFAGPRDDGFYVDLGGVFDLANILPPAVPTGLSPAGRAKPADGVKGFNVHSIALQIPINQLFSGGAPTTPSNDSTVAVWASASRRAITIRHENGSHEDTGPFVQVSRLGQPLINEAVIGLQDKDRWNALEPKKDTAKFAGYFDNPVIVRDADAVGIYAALGAEAAVPGLSSNRANGILGIISLADANHSFTDLGDVLRVDCSQDSHYPNGRALPDGVTGSTQEDRDVTDILLSVLLLGAGSGVSDNVSNNDAAFPGTFPFLALPWRGFDQGHGSVETP